MKYLIRQCAPVALQHLEQVLIVSPRHLHVAQAAALRIHAKLGLVPEWFAGHSYLTSSCINNTGWTQSLFVRALDQELGGSPHRGSAASGFAAKSSENTTLESCLQPTG
jgi:hypothetical protein